MFCRFLSNRLLKMQKAYLLGNYLFYKLQQRPDTFDLKFKTLKSKENCLYFESVSSSEPAR